MINKLVASVKESTMVRWFVNRILFHKIPFNAPHKPVLLLSILQAVQNSVIEENRIYITPEIVALFTANWSSLVITNNHCQFFLPFYRLQSEPFWKLIPKSGYENLLLVKSSITSLHGLNAAVEYAQIDEELFLLMKIP